MNKFAKALALFGAGSSIGTVTQIAKGKLGALLLGVDGVGVLNQLTNLWSLLYTLAGLGFYNGVIQRISSAEAAGDMAKVKTQFVTSLCFIAAFSIVSAAIAVGLSSSLSNLIFSDGGSRAWLVALILVSVPFAAISQIYSGLFSGKRLIRQVVKAQVFTDVFSLFLFAALILKGKLFGAAVAFSLSHVLKLSIQIYYTHIELGSQIYSSPRDLFQWREVWKTLSIGVIGLFLVAVGIATTMFVSRQIIEVLGMHANGLFSTAWKVCSLYFGALYASAAGFYLPVLSSSRNNDELSSNMNQAITLYMYVLTPLAVTLIVGGHQLMTILFNSDFAGAASLLVWFIPGDLFRVLSETIGLSFLAKRKLKSYAVTYCIWTGLFLIISVELIGKCGLIGVGYAYFISHLINALVTLLLARKNFEFILDKTSISAILVGLACVVTAAVSLGASLQWWFQYLAGALILFVWFIVSWRDENFKNLAKLSFNRIKRFIP